MLNWQLTVTKRVFESVHTVLEEGSRQRYTMFHSAFRTFVLSARPEVANTIRDRLIDWCAGHWISEHGYALSHYVDHLADVVVGSASKSQQAGALTRLEVILTSLAFIERKVRIGDVSALLRDYQTALQVWPDYVRYNPFDVQPRFLSSTGCQTA